MRILITDMPAIMRSIIEDAIVAQPDMQLVVGCPPPIRHVDEPELPDVVIAGMENVEDLAVPEAMLACWPRSRIFMIAVSGRRAVMHELRPFRTELGELSPAALLAAIRSERHRSQSGQTAGDGGTEVSGR